MKHLKRLEMKNQSEYEVASETTPAPEPEVPLEVQLLDTLEDSGATIPDRPLAVQSMQPVLDAIGDRRGAETLRMIFMRLPGGRRGTELRLALTQATADGCTDEAKRLGMSTQSLFQSIKRLRRRIFSKKCL
jgi:hypothetical protein